MMADRHVYGPVPYFVAMHWNPSCGSPSFHGTDERDVWECDGCPNRVRKVVGPSNRERSRYELIGPNLCATGTTDTGHARAASMSDAVEIGLLAINRAEQRAKAKHKEKPMQGTDQ